MAKNFEIFWVRRLLQMYERFYFNPEPTELVTSKKSSFNSEELM